MLTSVSAGTAVLATSNGDEVPDILFVVLPLFVLLVGGFFWYAAARDPIRRARRFLGLQTFDPNAGDEGDALVGVRGPVRAAGETVTGPITGEECVAYGHEEQSYRFGYKYDRERRQKMRRMANVDDEKANKRVWSWNTTSFDEEYVPFHVETDHGPVAVDPEGAELKLPVRADEKPSRITNFVFAVHPLTGNSFLQPLGRLPGLDALTPGRPSREVERHVESGDDVLVIGDADASDSAGADVVGTVDGGDDVDVFRVTTRSPRRLAVRSIFRVLRSSLIGVVSLLVAALIVYAGVIQGAY